MWKKWFAWYPIRAFIIGGWTGVNRDIWINDGAWRWCWWEWVEYKFMGDSSLDGGGNQYRVASADERIA